MAAKNPWISLIGRSKPPYLADCDKDAKLVDFWNLHLELVPKPYFGNIKKAKVVMLLLNPGFDEQESGVELNSSRLKTAQLSNLDPEKSRIFYLEDEFDWTAGGKWLREKLKPLIDTVGEESLIEKLMIIQYFPYNSQSYTVKAKNVLPSQNYNFDLVRQAIDKDLPILLMRHKNEWFDKVPKLKIYKHIIESSSINAIVSENNLGKENFDYIVEALR